MSVKSVAQEEQEILFPQGLQFVFQKLQETILQIWRAIFANLQPLQIRPCEAPVKQFQLEYEWLKKENLLLRQENRLLAQGWLIACKCKAAAARSRDARTVISPLILKRPQGAYCG